MKQPADVQDSDVISAETGLSQRDVEELRAALLAQREELVAKIRDHMGSAIAEDVGLSDEMDLASRDQEQAYLLRLAEKERKLVREVDHALARIEAGTYGVCEGTGEPIGLGRLRARPWSRYSIAHKEQMEREERARVRD